jgi:hypothetical protein
MTRRINAIGAAVRALHHARFSEGMEALADTPEKERLGRFSAGQECRSNQVAFAHVGRFSEGQQLLAETPPKELRGRFSESREARSRQLHLAA